MLYLLVAATYAAISATACMYPWNLNDTEVWGLASASATDAASCAAACCSQGDMCAVWQWCPSGAGCSPAASCWIGTLGGQIRRVAGWISASARAIPSAYFVNASGVAPTPLPIPGIAPSTDPSGAIISMDSRALRVNGVPLLPFAGEMHPSRVPASAWQADLDKMKAGVSITLHVSGWYTIGSLAGGQRPYLSFVLVFTVVHD